MLKQLRPALLMLLWLTLLTGVIYPLAVTGLAQVAFPNQANGSLLHRGDAVVGSNLIGQPFTSPKYFLGRPSATAPAPYDGSASTGSNLGPTNPALAERVGRTAQALGALGEGGAPIPLDLVTASASGLDPHISPTAAAWQVPRVAATRGLPEATVRALVDRFTQPRDLFVLGEPRVSVLALNMALDELARPAESPGHAALDEAVGQPR